MPPAFSRSNPTSSPGCSNGLVDTIDTINADPAAAATATNDGIEAITKNRLADETITGAFENLTFTVDPIASSLQGSADDAIAVGLLEDVDLDGIYDLTLLNEILAERGLEPVSDYRRRRLTRGRMIDRAPRDSPSRGDEDVRAWRDAVTALHDIDLTVDEGEFVCLVGASGCGKSTILNLVAGLDQPTAGEVLTRSRPTLMFQDAALFPWLTVRANVELPMRLAGVGKQQRRQRAEHLLETVHLGGFGTKRPHQLSGGMRQRAAMARAFAQDADILLMDEPFGALDAMTRDALHDELETLTRQRGLTVLFVTHNVREAARLGDRIVVLSPRPGPGQGDVRRRDPPPAADRITRRRRPRRRGHRLAARRGVGPCSQLTTSPCPRLPVADPPSTDDVVSSRSAPSTAVHRPGHLRRRRGRSSPPL